MQKPVWRHILRLFRNNKIVFSLALVKLLNGIGFYFQGIQNIIIFCNSCFKKFKPLEGWVFSNWNTILYIVMLIKYITFQFYLSITQTVDKEYLALLSCPILIHLSTFFIIVNSSSALATDQLFFLHFLHFCIA